MPVVFTAGLRDNVVGGRPIRGRNGQADPPCLHARVALERPPRVRVGRRCPGVGPDQPSPDDLVPANTAYLSSSGNRRGAYTKGRIVGRQGQPTGHGPIGPHDDRRAGAAQGIAPPRDPRPVRFTADNCSFTQYRLGRVQPPLGEAPRELARCRRLPCERGAISLDSPMGVRR